MSLVKLILIAIIGTMSMYLYMDNKYLRLKVKTLEADKQRLIDIYNKNSSTCDLYRTAIENLVKDDENETIESDGNTTIFNLDKL